MSVTSSSNISSFLPTSPLSYQRLVSAFHPSAGFDQALSLEEQNTFTIGSDWERQLGIVCVRLPSETMILCDDYPASSLASEKDAEQY